MKTTKIELTDKTWNPITGCSKISADCINCYAEVMGHKKENIALTFRKCNWYIFVLLQV